jgi:peroxiredoxin family protein
MSKTQTLQVEGVPQQAANKLAIIMSKGTIDMVYPAFMLATTGAAMGMEVHMFFTFWGMNVISKKDVAALKVAPVGNPALPMPNILGMLPGMTAMATRMMKARIRKVKLPTIPEIIKMASDASVHLHACSTTMEVMGVRREDLIPEVEDVVGAATFLELSQGGQTIFI